MDYCLSDGDGSATMWSAPPNTDLDADGALDAIGLDVDGDGTVDDLLADLDGDGVADHAVLDGQNYFTDDGSGTWAVSVDRDGLGPQLARGLRLLDVDGNGLADRALGDGLGYVDTDGDGTWDLKLTDSNGDGRADVANDL
ncbi:pullulanase [Mycobacterium sp. ITM-2016-00318]|uniref:pullulanase n=1 Tax=Mycobacterium sp. ITM-2016-00318 TaxID=2099693 RepID=UPI000CF92DE7|nr:pullulanase [Mycobacterium sp. ITM-2016-00318]WNG95693.1 pullulanase [Mycobacterium sp. ITM-2016-00318]